MMSPHDERAEQRLQKVQVVSDAALMRIFPAPPALAVRVAAVAMIASVLTSVAVACLCGAAALVKLTADFVTS